MRAEGLGPQFDATQDGRPYRLMMDWWITSRRVVARVAGTRKPLDLVHFLEAGARVANPATLRDDNLPTPSKEFDLPEGNLVLIEVPPDLDGLRKGGEDLHHEWRRHIQGVFERLFHAGYLVVDFVLLGEERVPRAFYLLSRGDATLG
jgi:predicted GNAT superfamily acetyltransferase